MLTKQQEKILKYLLSLKRDNQNRANISKGNYTLQDISENDFITCLYYFEQCNLINTYWYDTHKKDFGKSIRIELLPSALSYFDNKRVNKKSNRRDIIKTYIPIIISSISLLKSFEEEIASFARIILNIFAK